MNARREPGAAGETALYRYHDITGRPLYIGITDNLDGRERGHFRSSCWMPLMASSTVKRYPDRDAALKAERKAIETEHPLFNRQYNNTAAARDRQKAYLEEIGRMDLYTKWCLWRPPPMGELEMREVRRKRGAKASQSALDFADAAELHADQPSRKDVTLITKAAFQDQRLSWRARGLLAFVITLTPGERFESEWLEDQTPEGQEDTLGALAELTACGYYHDGVISDDKRAAEARAAA